MPAGDTPVLDREVAFRFALDLTAAQEQLARQLAGSRRFVHNRLLDGVHDRMTARVWEAELGTEPWTPWGWGKLDLIRQVTALRAAHAWLAAQPWDVAECAAVDLAAGLKHYSESRRGERKGRPVGFPKRKSRKAPRQSFRLRHPGQVHLDATGVTLPGLARTPLGRVKVCGPTRRLRRLLTQGRFRPVSVTVSFEHHRWWASIAGVAAAFHPARRTHARRNKATPGGLRPAKSPVPVGVDLGVRTLATAADACGVPIRVWEGVKSLRAAQLKLRRANKALARTKPGSNGHRRALDKLRRVHARVHGLRQDLLHQVSAWLVDRHSTVVVEDLNVAGMLADRRLALCAATRPWPPSDSSSPTRPPGTAPSLSSSTGSTPRPRPARHERVGTSTTTSAGARPAGPAPGAARTTTGTTTPPSTSLAGPPGTNTKPPDRGVYRSFDRR